MPKAGAENCSNVLPLDVVELAEIGSLSLDTDGCLLRVWQCRLADSISILDTKMYGKEESCQNKRTTTEVRKTGKFIILGGPSLVLKKGLLAQGKAVIHTSCRSESSN